MLQLSSFSSGISLCKWFLHIPQMPSSSCSSFSPSPPWQHSSPLKNQFALKSVSQFSSEMFRLSKCLLWLARLAFGVNWKTNTLSDRRKDLSDRNRWGKSNKCRRSQESSSLLSRQARFARTFTRPQRVHRAKRALFTRSSAGSASSACLYLLRVIVPIITWQKSQNKLVYFSHLPVSNDAIPTQSDDRGGAEYRPAPEDEDEDEDADEETVMDEREVSLLFISSLISWINKQHANMACFDNLKRIESVVWRRETAEWKCPPKPSKTLAQRSPSNILLSPQ